MDFMKLINSSGGESLEDLVDTLPTEEEDLIFNTANVQMAKVRDWLLEHVESLTSSGRGVSEACLDGLNRAKEVFGIADGMLDKLISKPASRKRRRFRAGGQLIQGKRPAYVALVRDQLRCELPYLAHTEANRQTVFACASRIVREHGLRPSDACRALPLIVAAFFVPLPEDIAAASVTRSWVASFFFRRVLGTAPPK
nr:21.8 kDa replication protein [Cnidium virus Z]WUR07254.1 21.8 kDa replication protein [Cnidium virus Z]WUR07258.1 21.8 kDa replication protein [Cnidium virus Z]WUR07266.1 21.8 kDa replication protein [Cnidium virus Z]